MADAKPVLVTGGCGFVGRHLIKKLLERGVTEIWTVDNLSTGRVPSEWLGTDWTEGKNEGGIVRYTSGDKTLCFIEADALSFFRDHALGTGKHAIPSHFSDAFHLASIVGGRALIDGDPIYVAMDLGIDAMFFFWATRDPSRVERILYASSSAAYPVSLQKENGAQALTESDIDFKGNLGTPDMTYGWSKLTGEFLSKLAHERYGLHVACVRPFSGYGEDQDLTYPTPSIALRVASHESPIDVWGTGMQARDFVHIDDCVDAFFAILDKVNDGSGINIGTGKLTTFIDLIKTMLEVEGHDAPINPLSDKPVGVANRYADTTKLNEVIGWKPSISLEEGVRRVLEGAHKRRNGSDLPFSLS